MIRRSVWNPTVLMPTTIGAMPKLEALGQYQEAIVDYDQAIELDPNFSLPYLNRGNAKLEYGQYQEAIVDYDQAA